MFNMMTVCKGVGLHVDGRDMSLPIFWEDRIVRPNISSNSITLFFMYTYDVGVGGGLLSLTT